MQSSRDVRARQSCLGNMRELIGCHVNRLIQLPDVDQEIHEGLGGQASVGFPVGLEGQLLSEVRDCWATSCPNSALR